MLKNLAMKKKLNLKLLSKRVVFKLPMLCHNRRNFGQLDSIFLLKQQNFALNHLNKRTF
jgi:hypothetical protein